MSSRKKSGLGNNPLTPVPTSQGIFQKTESVIQNPEDGIQSTDVASPQTRTKQPTRKNPESRKRKPEPGFLETDRELDKVTLRIPIELNDWLDDLLKQGKRKHGQKIPKEIWVQAALELFKSMPVDWSEVQSIDEMREKLQILENGKQSP
jgi:hypothetical protein